MTWFILLGILSLVFYKIYKSRKRIPIVQAAIQNIVSNPDEWKCADSLKQKWQGGTYILNEEWDSMLSTYYLNNFEISRYHYKLLINTLKDSYGAKRLREECDRSMELLKKEKQ